MNVKGTTIRILMGQAIVLLAMMLFPVASTAAPARIPSPSGNDADLDSNIGSARQIRRNYGYRNQLSVPFMDTSWRINRQQGRDVLVPIDESDAQSGNQRSNQQGQRRLKKSLGPGTIMVGPTRPGPVYVWPVPIPSYISTVPTKRDEGIMDNLLPTFGLPLSDTQFQIIRRYNDNIFLEQVFDPERIIWMATEVSHIMATSAANSGGNLAINQAQSAIDFTEKYLTNFTAEAGNQWQKIRDKLFLPMAVLLLLPGAVLAQAKAVVASGSSVIEQSQGPFEGIMRSIVAAFLIPGSFLVINYGIDVANSITFTIGDEYKRLFGSNMYEDAQCTEIRAFAPNDMRSNDNAVFKEEEPPPSTNDALRNPHEQLHQVRRKDPCARLDESLVPDERVRVRRGIERPVTNFANVALTGAWNVLCAFQMAFLYYLWCMGPIAAALWVWPIKGLRSAFPSWVEGVITLCFWSLFWNTAILLLACFRGVADNSVVIVSALNFLANVCVKYAFDFSGLVSEAGYQAASDMTRSMNQARDEAQKAAAGATAQPAAADGNGNGSSPYGALLANHFGPGGSGTNLGEELGRRMAEHSRFGGNGDSPALAGIAGGLLGSAPEVAVGARPDGTLVGPPPAEGLGAATFGLGAAALLAATTGLMGAPPLGSGGSMISPDLARQLQAMAQAGGPFTPEQLATMFNRDGLTDPARMALQQGLSPVTGQPLTQAELNQLLGGRMPDPFLSQVLTNLGSNPLANNAALVQLAQQNPEAAAKLAPWLATDTSLANTLGLFKDGQPPVGAFSYNNGALHLQGEGAYHQLLAANGSQIMGPDGRPYQYGPSGVDGKGPLAVLDGTRQPIDMTTFNQIKDVLPQSEQSLLLANQARSLGFTPPVLSDPVNGQTIPVTAFTNQGAVALDAQHRPLHQFAPAGQVQAVDPNTGNVIAQAQIRSQYDPQTQTNVQTAYWTPTDTSLYNQQTGWTLPPGIQPSKEPTFDPQTGRFTVPLNNDQLAVLNTASTQWTTQAADGSQVIYNRDARQWQYPDGATAYLNNAQFQPELPQAPQSTVYTAGGFTSNAGDALPLRGPATPERLVLDGMQTGAPGVSMPQPQTGFDPSTLVQNPGQNAFMAPTLGAYTPQPHIIEQSMSPHPVPQPLIPDVYATNLNTGSPGSMVPNISTSDVPPVAGVQPTVVAQHVPAGPEIVQMMPQTTHHATPVVGEQPNPIIGEQPRVVASITPPIAAVPPTPVQANPYVTNVPTPPSGALGQWWNHNLGQAGNQNLGQGGIDPLSAAALAAMRMAPKKPVMPDPKSRRAPEVIVQKVSGSLQQNMGANQQGVVNADEQEIQRLAKEGLDKITGVQRLGGTKILMVIAPENFTDEELLKPKSIFIGEGAEVKIASNKPGEIKGTSGVIVNTDLLIGEVDPAQFDAIVVVGGSGTQELLSNDKDLHQLLRTMSDTGKIVAGISLSSMILAQAGILEGRKVTGWPSAESIAALEQAHASYVDKSVVQDGEIITGGSSEHVDEFADKIVEELSKIASVSAIDGEHSSPQRQGESP